jgi:hypothetical protein
MCSQFADWVFRRISAFFFGSKYEHQRENTYSRLEPLTRELPFEIWSREFLLHGIEFKNQNTQAKTIHSINITYSGAPVQNTLANGIPHESPLHSMGLKTKML